MHAKIRNAIKGIVEGLWPNSLTGISVRRATDALDVKHTTETTAKPATCMWYQIFQDFKFIQ